MSVIAPTISDARAGTETETGEGRGWASRRLPLLVVAGALGVGLLVSQRSGIDVAPVPAPPPVAPVVDAVAGEQVAGRDLSGVSNEEMEAVIAENPGIVPMRLALVERYLRAGSPADLQMAHDHAETARSFEAGVDDEARALRYSGWTAALLGRPGEGARVLEQSLEVLPGDLDTLWFLANVRLTGLADPTAAAALCERILAEDIDADQRDRVEQLLRTAQAALTPPPAPPG